MGKLWSYLEGLGSLLEQDERQSVLGDIQERGADWRAAFELTGLVALRQLQGWKSWRLWVLALALYAPARMAAWQTQSIAKILYSGQVSRPWEILVACVFSWAVGFSLGSLGRRRAGSLLLLLPVVFALDIRQITRFTFGPPEMTVVAFPSLAVAARLAFLEYVASMIAMTVMLAMILGPCVLGFARGISGRPVSLRLAILLVTACLPTFWSMLWPVYRFSSVQMLARALILIPTLWPVFYALLISRRSRTVYN